MEVKLTVMSCPNLLHRRHQALRNLPYFRLFVLLDFGSKCGIGTASILLLARRILLPSESMPVAASSVTQASRASLCTWTGR